jgi:hypothetical protein
MRTTWVLVAAIAALAALLAWLWLVPPAGGLRWQAPAPVKPDLRLAAQAAFATDDGDASRYMAILDRPVFSPTRKPAPVAAAPAKAGDPLEGLHLYGVYGGPDGGGVIVRSEGRSRRVKVSESLGDWTLKEVRGTQATFARGAEIRTVALVQARQDGAQATAGASAATAGQGRPPVDVRNAKSGNSSATSVLSDIMRRAAASRASAPAAAVPAASQPPPAVAGREAEPAAAPARRLAPGASPFSIGGTR